MVGTALAHATLALGLIGVGVPWLGHAGYEPSAAREQGITAIGTSSCPRPDAASTFVGDLLSCAFPEPQDGAAGGLPPDPFPQEFERIAGLDYAGAYGPEPERLPLPKDCAKPVRGTYSTDLGVINSVVRETGRTVVNATLNGHWDSGIGSGGRSVVSGDFWVNPNGVSVAVGRTLFEGTIDGRTGSMVVWEMGNVYPNGRYIFESRVIGGTEELRNIRLEAHAIGFLGKSGHWVGPSRYCFLD